MYSDNQYWNNYYKEKHSDIIKNSLFAEYVLKKWFNGRKHLIELGCGNGRDALYFSRNNIDVVAIDASSTTINSLARIPTSCEFIQEDFVQSTSIFTRKYDICYSRFTIHAISLEDEKKLISKVYQTLDKNGIFCIETRSVKDDLYGKGKEIGKDEYIYNEHYRRFIRMNEILNRLIEAGFCIKYAEENVNFAPLNEKNPITIRIIAEKED